MRSESLWETGFRSDPELGRSDRRNYPGAAARSSTCRRDLRPAAPRSAACGLKPRSARTAEPRGRCCCVQNEDHEYCRSQSKAQRDHRPRPAGRGVREPRPQCARRAPRAHRPGLTGAKRKAPPWLERQRRAGLIRVGSLKPVAEVLKGFPPGSKLAGTDAIDALLEERSSAR